MADLELALELPVDDVDPGEPLEKDIYDLSPEELRKLYEKGAGTNIKHQKSNIR